MKGLLGRLVRMPLRLVPAAAVMPVVSGGLRGARWVVGSATHGAWLGRYERENQRWLERTLRAGDRFVDVGANVGFFSLLAARLVGAHGAVLAVEPDARNLEMLRRHCLLNGADNVEIVPVALAGQAGRRRFGQAGCGAMSRLDEAGQVEIDSETLDSLVERSNWRTPPRMIKIDVEGAEVEVLAGGERTLTTRPRPLLLIATHGSQRHRDSLAVLARFGITVASEALDKRTGHGSIVTSAQEADLR